MSTDSEQQRRNVLYIISDQHQPDCFGAAGHPQAITPNLDRLAASGVNFTQAYAQNTICTPSRVSILSGQYCHNHGYYQLSGPTPRHLPSFLSHFRRHGYRTAAIGKLHLPDLPDPWLDDHVDLRADCYKLGNPFPDPEWKDDSPYYEYLSALGLHEKADSRSLPEFPDILDRHNRDARPSNLPFEHSVEGWCEQVARQFMGDCRGQPFCIQVSLPKPTSAFTPDRRFWDMYEKDLALPALVEQNPAHRPPHFRRMVDDYRHHHQWLFEPKTFEAGARRMWRGYLANVTHMDHTVGLLLDFLEISGLADNTIVIYGSDHGAYSGVYGVREKAPGICSEMVCRVPLIWRVPGLTTTGRTCRQLVENVDICQTVTSLCGLPAIRSADGRDLSALLAGGDEAVRAEAVTENVWSRAIRWDRWRLVHYQPEHFHGEDMGELYDLQEDPWELCNLYREQRYQSVVCQGRRRLLEWLIRTTRPITAGFVAPDGPNLYPLAEDGKAPSAVGTASSLIDESVNYL